MSAWHHHGERHPYGFLISGRMRLEFGPNGRDAVELSPGDFSIPPGLIHRDVNVSKKRKALLANVLLGGGPAVEVKGPEATPNSGPVIHKD